VLTVSDTGIGIPPDLLSKIFEPFFTTKESGTGMGLAAVQGTVLEHQGMVEVESELGRGTTFRLLLPLSEESVGIDVPLPAPQAPVLAGRVLVVDDEATVATVIRRTLERGGYHVELCSNGRDALSRYSRDAFDLVLLDVMMPDLDGVEVLRRLRAKVPDVKVMLMTGHAGETVEARLREFSDVIVLSKPFYPKQLLEEIRQVLTR
jgi:two-component system cell cycle sensor histidine kinase/response regulator CckA